MADTKHLSFHLFYGGLLLLVVGLPLSIFLVSVSQFIILGSWFWSGNLKTKLFTAFTNKSVWILISIYLFLVAGLLYSRDLSYGLKDLRIKLPLLLLPVLFSSMPSLTIKQFKLLLWLFILSTLISSFISTGIYAGLTHKVITDIRQISPFMSHIRLGIYVCMAIYCCCWLIFNLDSNLQRMGVLCLISWFLYFLLLLESITAYSILASIALLFTLVYIFRTKKKWVGIGAFILLSLLIFSGINYLNKVWKEVSFVDDAELKQLKSFTASGCPYTHDINSLQTENGHRVGINLCEPELKKSWNKRSSLSYEGLNLRGDNLRMTLLRFLTSKGLAKDSAAIYQLSDEEISAIEKGVANVEYMDRKSLKPRIKITLWELHQYLLYRNPDGHSIAMRLEFWRTASLLIRENWLIGVGTGDVPDAFASKYKEIDSPLSEKYRFRAHNQFITTAVTLGIPFLLWFMASLVIPAFNEHKTQDYLYLAFLLTAVFSFLTEDTLETQAGLTFYAFFNCLFLFLYPLKRQLPYSLKNI